MYEGLRLKILGWKILFSVCEMGLAAEGLCAWCYEMLEQRTPWFERVVHYWLCRQIICPRVPSAERTEVVGLRGTAGEERDVITGCRNVVGIEGMGDWRENMKVETGMRLEMCVAFQLVFSSWERLWLQVCLPPAFFWRVPAASGAVHWLGNQAIFCGLSGETWGKCTHLGVCAGALFRMSHLGFVSDKAVCQAGLQIWPQRSSVRCLRKTLC